MSYIDHTIGAYLRRSVFFPFYWKYIKRFNVLGYYQELKNHQWNTVEENREIQRIKLFKLIKYASQNIPYYKKMIKEHNIQFSEDTIFDDIKKFPLLTKDIIRNHFDGLYKFRDSTYYTNSSGGSTGEPVKLYQDKYYLEWVIATKILFDEWAGRRIGDPMVRISASLSDALRGGQNFKGYLRQKFYGVTVLNSNRMTDKSMYEFVQKINHIKPGLILTYTSSIDTLACFIQKNNISIHSPRAIMSTASVLYPEIQKKIEKVFRAIVFNRYGSREVGDIACNCEKSSGLHLIPDIHYLEVVDNKGKEVALGKTGNIIITLLTNYTMPLIRYKIGDRGILSDMYGQCEHGFPLLEKINGRIKSVFINKFGDYIDDDSFFVLFHPKENIKKFQIIQEAVEYIIINLVLMDQTKLKDVDKEFREISQKIRRIMGEGTKIKYNIVDEIKPSPSGKHMYAFSRVKD